MTEKKKWLLQEVLPIAKRLYQEFSPHCHRICVVGSIRRGASEVSDIDLICIPKTFNWGLLKDGLAEAVDKYEKISGTMNGDAKHVRRETPEGVGFDLWLINENNWGLVVNTRTGPLAYSRGTLAASWVKKGYRSENNHLINQSNGELVPVKEEVDLFNLLGVPYKHPKDR